MRKVRVIYPVVFAAALVVAFAARTLWFYQGFYRAPDVPQSTPPSIESLADQYEFAADLEAESIPVLIDIGHNNAFREDELAVFAGRLTSNGAQIEYVDSGDLVSRLHEAHSLIVVLPSATFSTDEIQAIKQFVDKGGRLVVFGDPTRLRSVEALNSLTGGFGVTYLDDYVYNLVENDGGFRNVIFTEFDKNAPVTKGVKRVVFQTAHSLRADEESGVILGDDNTFSSRSEQPGGVIAATLTGEGRVLCLPDFTFLISPYNSFADNDVLIDNIVSFALTSERTFDLQDFPYFFASATQIYYQDTVTLNNTFADSVALRAFLDDAGVPAVLTDEIDEESDLIYVSLYEDSSDDITNLLESEGITISDEPLSEEDDAPLSEGSIHVEGVVTLEKGGTVLLHLVRPPEETEGESDEETAPVYQLTILASSEEDLSTGIDLLLSGNLDECLVTPLTAICHTGEVEEDGLFPTPTPSAGGKGNFLVVADDQFGDADFTSASTIVNTLFSLGYQATYHSTEEEGVPTVTELMIYDAVFWSVGENCCDTPTEEGVNVLMSYIDQGGNVFIDGIAIAFLWGGTDFMESYLGAEYIGYDDLIDLELGPELHPLSLGFPDKLVMAEPVLSADIIQPLGSDVVFVRGSDSPGAGEAALVARDLGSARMAYAVFPLYLLEENELNLLLLNAVLWFLG